MKRERRPISLVIGALAAMLAGTLAITATPAAAVPFGNPNPINIPDPDCITDPDTASPYPSVINVSGLSGTVSDVNVTLHGVSHPFEGDLEILLVGPGGGSQNLVLLSDAGTGSLSNAAVHFDDSASAVAPQNTAWGPGTYKPTNYSEVGKPDAFPSPAPAPSANTTLAGAFNGISPNGDWSLYVVDDGCPDAGSIGGGWTIDITTLAAAATSTSVTSSLNPSRTGQTVTFTATVTSSGSPVTTGTVTFTDGATVLAANASLNAGGQAFLFTSALAEGNHNIVATYNGTAQFATSSGAVNQRVDNNTVVTGSQYCNTGPITIPDDAPATPYPSNIFVTGAAPTWLLTDVNVTLKNVSHTFAGDIEALLVGPHGQNLVLVSDAGTASVTNVTVTFDDAAAGPLPATGTWAAANSTISADPTDYNELVADTFPPPAPAPSAATTLATFNGTNPNGTWSLYVKDDAGPASGTIAGGWCLTPSTADTTPASVTINQAVGQADPTSQSPINFTATFSKQVTGFTGTDVSFAGSTAGGTLVATVTGGPTVYNIAVTGMTTSGTVVVSIPPGVATDLSGNPNTASTSTDNTVSFVRAHQSLPGVVVSSTNWSLRSSLTTGPPTITFSYGTRPLVPLMGDWDGDGDETAGTFEAGTFKLRNTNSAGPPDVTFTFGDPRGWALAGDFDGDNLDDVAVYRNGLWQVRFADDGATASFLFGSGSWPSTVPVAGDWNRDGVDGIGTYTLANGTWALRQTASAGPPDAGTFVFWTGSGSYPVVGDWDADGDDTVGVKAGTTWLLNNVNDSSGPDVTVDFGGANDLPVVWAQ